MKYIYTGNDVEIFVLTYNRASLLPSTIKSIIDQDVTGIKISVFDNGSTDNTKNITQSFTNCDIKYFNNLENNHLEAWVQIKKLITRKWVMVFHDDDLMHPSFIKYVLHAINSSVNVSLVGAQMKKFEQDDSSTWYVPQGVESILLDTPTKFACLLYKGYPLPFCSAVYNSEAFKATELNVEMFGKMFDRPFMMDISKYGSVVILKGSYIKVRIHKEQDSNSIAKGNYIRPLLELNKFYKFKLGQNPLTSSGLLFISKNYTRLLGAYHWMGGSKSGIQRQQFFSEALRIGASSKVVLAFGFIFDIFLGLPYRLTKRALVFVNSFLIKFNLF